MSASISRNMWFEEPPNLATCSHVVQENHACEIAQMLFLISFTFFFCESLYKLPKITTETSMSCSPTAGLCSTQMMKRFPRVRLWFCKISTGVASARRMMRQKNCVNSCSLHGFQEIVSWTVWLRNTCFDRQDRWKFQKLEKWYNLICLIRIKRNKRYFYVFFKYKKKFKEFLL